MSDDTTELRRYMGRTLDTNGAVRWAWKYLGDEPAVYFHKKAPGRPTPIGST